MKILMAENQRKTILNAIPDDGTMLEWGSGGSTIWFLENMKESQSLISVEQDPIWSSKLKVTTQTRQFKTAWQYITPSVPTSIIAHHRKSNATINEELPVGLDKYIKPVSDVLFSKINVFLVDGVARGACLMQIATRAKDDVEIFLHDTTRDWYNWALSNFELIDVIEPSPGDYPAQLKHLRLNRRTG